MSAKKAAIAPASKKKVFKKDAAKPKPKAAVPVKPAKAKLAKNKAPAKKSVKKDASKVLSKAPKKKPHLGRTVALARPGDPLKPRRRKFVEHYARTLNGTQSVLKAGYNTDKNGAAVMASVLLRNVKVKKAIEERLSQTVIGPDEVSARLSRIARADFGVFLKYDDSPLADGSPELDLNSPQARENSVLIKDYKTEVIEKIVSNGDDGEESMLRITKTSIKLHDASPALIYYDKKYVSIASGLPLDNGAHDSNAVTINGNVVVGADAAAGFLAKVLNVDPEQIPRTPEALMEGIKNDNGKDTAGN